MKLAIATLFAFITIAATNAQTPTPTPTPDKRPFLMPVEDVFTISGRGVVVTGKVERGVLKVGDAVEVVGIKETKTATVTGIEMFRKMLGEGKAGDDVGVLLRGVAKDDVVRGQVLAKPGSIKAYTKFKAKIDMLPTASGGRTTPITGTFRPMVSARTQLLSGSVTLPSGKSSVAPGEKSIEVEIVVTESAPLEKGQSITLREGTRTIATGSVTILLQ